MVKEYDRTLPQIAGYAGRAEPGLDQPDRQRASARWTARGTLTIRTSGDDDCLVVEIGDTGPGIPADIQARIFEPFFTTKPVGEGTGLGLDISYRIVVNKHHGDLSVLSVPGDTRFRVRLPLAGPDQLAAMAAGSADDVVAADAADPAARAS